MSTQQQQPDGTWAPATPEPYHPGYDLERYDGGRWVLYRTTHSDSFEVASGSTWLGMVAAYWWHRLWHPIRCIHEPRKGLASMGVPPPHPTTTPPDAPYVDHDG